MSQSQPNPEERERIVTAAVDDLKKRSPELFPTAPTDLDVFFHRLDAAINAVEKTMVAAINVGNMNGTNWQASGRRALENRATIAFLDAFVQMKLNRDELLFALAFTHAKLLIERHL